MGGGHQMSDSGWVRYDYSNFGRCGVHAGNGQEVY